MACDRQPLSQQHPRIAMALIIATFILGFLAVIGGIFKASAAIVIIGAVLVLTALRLFFGKSLDLSELFDLLRQRRGHPSGD